MRRRMQKRPMRGGYYSDINAPYHAGNFAQSQQQAGSSVGASPDLTTVQSGGRRKRRRSSKQRGGLFELNPEPLGAPMGGPSPAPAQSGGYFPALLKSALAPFGLTNFNGKTAYKGKSRLSRKLSSRRHRR